MGVVVRGVDARDRLVVVVRQGGLAGAGHG
jgi:hypothetical protein